MGLFKFQDLPIFNNFDFNINQIYRQKLNIIVFLYSLHLLITCLSIHLQYNKKARIIKTKPNTLSWMRKK